MEIQKHARLRDDLLGGLVSAALSIPLAIGYGMFAFGALGNSYFASGALSGLYAAVVVGIACVAFGARSTTLYAPRVTTTFFLGALLYQLVHSDSEVLRSGNHSLIVLAFFLIIFLGGVFQALFGLVRLGSLMRFTPHPVMAGLQNAAAALLFLVQLGNVCGFDRIVSFTAVPMHWLEVKPLSLVVSSITFVVMLKARAITTKIPPLLVGLGVGSVIYYSLVLAGYGPYLGSSIGLPDAADSLSPLKSLGGQILIQDIVELLPLIVSGAFALAVVAALDALLCAKLVATPGSGKIDGDRLLVRLGLGNMLSAGFGGITSGINIGPSIANRAFGAKTYVSVLINAAILLLVIEVLFPFVSYLPRAVLSAAIMVIAVQHIDPWSIELVRRIRKGRSHDRRFMLLDLLVISTVAALSVTINIVFAVLIGMVIAIALFTVRMSHTNIRRIYSCDTIRSRKARPPKEVALLDELGSKILILELQGVLFFGSAETLSEEIERLCATGIRSIILDLRRVTEVDATGARILGEIRNSLSFRNLNLALTIRKGSEIATHLSESGIVDTLGTKYVFEDVDRAIEWAEDELIQFDNPESTSEEMNVENIDLFSTFTPEEIRTVMNHTKRKTYSRGATVFSEGDAGNTLFIITKGRVSAYLNQGNNGVIRLATFAPGTIFGEVALLDSGLRSASVVADEDIVLYALDEAEFTELGNNASAVAIKILSGIGRILSGRLRRATRTIQQLES